MKKALALIIRKLDKHPISSLSKLELRTYFNHRLENLVFKKKVLVRNELEYLLGETGPGNLRIDPEFLSSLTKKSFFMFPGFEKIPEIKTFLDKKREIEKYIFATYNSPEIQKKFLDILGNYLKEIKLVSASPFIIKGIYNNIPVACLLKNNGWITPNTELFSFLSKCQKEKTFSILMAKKISGILFPIFKNLSVLGLNTYKIYLPREAQKLIESIKLDGPLFSELKYYNQFQFIDNKFSKEIIENHWEGEAIKKFFEIILKTNISNYYVNFLRSKIEIKSNFVDIISQFRKNKVNKSLIENYQGRAKLIQDLTSA